MQGAPQRAKTGRRRNTSFTKEFLVKVLVNKKKKYLLLCVINQTRIRLGRGLTQSGEEQLRNKRIKKNSKNKTSSTTKLYDR